MEPGKGFYSLSAILNERAVVDRDGFPLAMCIEPGNKAETSTLKPMEEILKDKFGLPKLVVCTDGGLSSYDNRKNDSIWTLHQCQRVRRWSSASS